MTSVDAVSFFCLYQPMSNATSITLQKSRATLGTIGHTIWCSILMALPLSGLVLFFEMTQPAKVMNAGFSATQIASVPSDPISDGNVRPWVLPGHASIARFEGVSAQVRSDKADSVNRILTASDAERAFARAPFGSLKPGFYTEFLTRERRRIALLIVSREPLVDRPIPDNARLMNFTDASTANTMTFVWGQWLYKVDIEDKGVEPDVVVQKVL